MTSGHSTLRSSIAMVLALMTFSTSHAQTLSQLSFKQAATFCTVPAGGGCNALSQPHGVASGDLMGATGPTPDGLPELVVLNQNERSISILRNNGTASWSGNPPSSGLTLLEPLLQFPDTPFQPHAITLADMDSANGLDIILTVNRLPSGAGPELAPQVIILYNQGGGVFNVNNKTVITLSAARELYSLVIYDPNGMDTLDIAVASAYSVPGGKKPAFELIYGPRLSTGGWTPSAVPLAIQQHRIVAPEHPLGQGFATDVVNGAVCPPPGRCCDLAVSMRFTDAMPPFVAIYRHFGNLPDGTVSYELIPSPNAGNSWSVRFAKLRSNASLKDLVLAADTPTTDNPLIVQTNDHASCSYASPPIVHQFVQLSDPYGIASDKLDLNGSPDLVVACRSGIGPTWQNGGVAVFQAQGGVGGTYHDPPREYLVSSTGAPKPQFVIIDDMNDDGLNDIVTSNTNDGTVAVLINNTPLQE